MVSSTSTLGANKTSQRDWLGIVLGIVAGVIISYVFYWLSLEKRQLIFAVEPVRTKILSTSSAQDKPFRVLRNDGSEIKSDITSIRFYFWNAGNQAIKREEVLQPIKIFVDDTDAKILGAELLSRSRDVIDFSLSPDVANESRSLNVDFLILEQNDGVTGQIIYEGDPKATFSVQGTVEGVRQIGGVRSINRLQIFPFLCLVIPMAGLSIVMFTGQRNEARKAGKPLEKSIYWTFLSSMLAVLIPVMLVGWFIVQSDFVPQSNLAQFVPQSVLPEDNRYPPDQDFDMR